MGIFDRKQVRPEASAVAGRVVILHAVVLHAMMAPPRDMLGEIMAGWTEADRRKFEADTKEKLGEFWGRLGALTSQMSPWEREFAASTMVTMTQRQQLDASWRIESFQALLWSLGRLGELPGFDVQADHNILKEYAPEGLEQFVKKARLLPTDRIDRMRDLAETWHWRSRTRQLIEEGRDLGPTPQMLSAGLRTFDDIVRLSAETAAKEGRIPETKEGDFVAFGKPYRSMTAEEWSIVRSITMERHFALNWLCGYAPGNHWDETPTDT
jgi:hypothetical protein